MFVSKGWWHSRTVIIIVIVNMIYPTRYTPQYKIFFVADVPRREMKKYNFYVLFNLSIESPLALARSLSPSLFISFRPNRIRIHVIYTFTVHINEIQWMACCASHSSPRVFTLNHISDYYYYCYYFISTSFPFHHHQRSTGSCCRLSFFCLLLLLLPRQSELSFSFFSLGFTLSLSLSSCSYTLSFNAN